MNKVRNMIHGNLDIYANFNPLPLDLQGWSSHSPVFEYVLNKIKPKLIVEVGTWKGRSAVHMADIMKDIHDDFEIVCIDTWLGSVEHWTDAANALSCSTDPQLNALISQFINGRPNLYEQFISNIMHMNLTDRITPLPVDSINGSLILSKLNVQADVIYIDAGHDYDSVVMDLQNYKKLVRPGGILIGDDWFHMPIKKAAADVFGKTNVQSFSHDKFIWENK